MTRTKTTGPPLDLRATGADFGYPFTNHGWVVILALALLDLVRYGGWVSWGLSLLVVLLVIQSTMRGEKEMPSLPQLEKAGSLARLWWEGFAVTVLAMWPWTLLLLIWLLNRLTPDEHHLDWTIPILPFLAFFTLAYWPACLGLVAAGYGIIGALTPSLVKGVFRAGYAPVLVIVLMGGFLFLILNAVLNQIPHVGGVLGRLLVIWFQLVVARFVGRAMLAFQAGKIE